MPAWWAGRCRVCGADTPQISDCGSSAVYFEGQAPPEFADPGNSHLVTLPHPCEYFTLQRLDFPMGRSREAAAWFPNGK